MTKSKKMATDLNNTLNLDKLITNLDEVIKKTMQLNEVFKDLNKTAEDTAKTTEQVNKTQEQSEDIIKDVTKATNQLTVDEIERAKLQDKVVKTAEQLTVINSEENKQLIKNKVAIQQANKEIRDNIKENLKREQTQEKVNEALTTSANSIKEAQAQNKILREAVRDVDLTAEDATQTIEELNAKIEQNDEIITENSDSFIQQKRNIGNYQSALDDLRGSFGDLTGSISSFITNPQGGTEAVKNAIGGINTSLKTLLANPVVAIVAGITASFQALKTALNSTEEGQKALNTVTGFFNGILTALNEVVIALIDPLVRLFNDPKKTLEEFNQAIKDKILKTFEALKNIALGVGDILTGIWNRDLDQIKQGAADAGKAFVDLNREINPTVILLEKAVKIGENIAETSKENARIEKERFELEQQRNALTVKEAELRKEIADLLLQSKNEELSAQERLQNVIEAEEVSKQLSAERIADKKEELRLLLEEAELGKNNLQDNQAIAALQAEIINLQKQEADNLRSLGNRRRTIINEIERQKEAEQELFTEQQERFNTQKQQDIDTRTLKVSQDNEDLKAAEDRAQKEIELAQAVAEGKAELSDFLKDTQLENAAILFDEEKRASLANAQKNISEGVTKALATGGIRGIAQGVLITAAGAVQLAKIAGINAFYKGTDNAPSGLAWVSERGAELIEDKAGNLKLIPDLSLVNFKGGEKVHTAAETKKMLFDDSRIIKELRRQKQTVIVNVNKDTYASKYRLKA